MAKKTISGSFAICLLVASFILTFATGQSPSVAAPTSIVAPSPLPSDMRVYSLGNAQSGNEIHVLYSSRAIAYCGNVLRYPNLQISQAITYQAFPNIGGYLAQGVTGSGVPSKPPVSTFADSLNKLKLNLGKNTPPTPSPVDVMQSQFNEFRVQVLQAFAQQLVIIDEPALRLALAENSVRNLVVKADNAIAKVTTVGDCDQSWTTIQGSTSPTGSVAADQAEKALFYDADITTRMRSYIKDRSDCSIYLNADTIEETKSNITCALDIDKISDTAIAILDSEAVALGQSLTSLATVDKTTFATWASRSWPYTFCSPNSAGSPPPDCEPGAPKSNTVEYQRIQAIAAGIHAAWGKVGSSNTDPLNYAARRQQMLLYQTAIANASTFTTSVNTSCSGARGREKDIKLTAGGVDVTAPVVLSSPGATPFAALSQPLVTIVCDSKVNASYGLGYTNRPEAAFAAGPAKGANGASVINATTSSNQSLTAAYLGHYSLFGIGDGDQFEMHLSVGPTVDISTSTHPVPGLFYGVGISSYRAIFVNAGWNFAPQNGIAGGYQVGDLYPAGQSLSTSTKWVSNFGVLISFPVGTP